MPMPVRNDAAVVQILLAFFLVSTPPARPVMNDKVFFDSINLRYPGIEAVRSALLSGDTTLAKAKLLEYYQKQSSVRYFELSGTGSVSDADRNLNQEFKVLDLWQNCKDVDGTLIDWTKAASDAEWHWQFHRMNFLTNLAKVYGRTPHDEKYARGWMAILIDWIRENTPGYPRTLDTGIRLRNWVDSYQWFIPAYRSPSITAEDHTTVLKSLIEQSLFLKNNWRSTGNWGADETRGLGAVVVMFPEFLFSPGGAWDGWRDLVLARLQHHLSGDFYPDGVQFETSPSYHSLEYRNLFAAYQLMNMNGIALSQELLNLFIRPLEFMMHIHRPDGLLPQLSDTDQEGFLDDLRAGGEAFNRQDMLYAATGGKQGIPPLQTFAPFPDGGYFVMRSSWGQGQTGYRNTQYLVFDTGSNEPWHAHYDILNFEAYAFGNTVVKDPGRYTYNTAGGWRDYFKNTSAHNTVVVDGGNQNAKAKGSASWETMPGYDYVRGSDDDAYKNIRHQRKLFYVKPEYWIVSDLLTGSGFHTYDLLFHLDPAYQNNVALNADRSIRTSHFSILPADSEASVQIVPGYVSTHYGIKKDAPIVKYSRQGTVPVHFETVVYPFSGSVPSMTVGKFETVNGNGRRLPDTDATALKIRFPDRTDVFCMNHSGEDALIFGDYRFKGEVAYARENAAGALVDVGMVRGYSLMRRDTVLVQTNGIRANVSRSAHLLSIRAETKGDFIVWAPGVDSVQVNGEGVPYRREGNHVLVGLTSAVAEPPPFGRGANQIHLFQNYPNPFNGETIIHYSIPLVDRVRLEIFDIRGKKMTSLFDGMKASGSHSAIWDGKDVLGNTVTSGIYLCRIQAGSHNRTMRILLIK